MMNNEQIFPEKVLWNVSWQNSATVACETSRSLMREYFFLSEKKIPVQNYEPYTFPRKWKLLAMEKSNSGGPFLLERYSKPSYLFQKKSRNLLQFSLELNPHEQLRLSQIDSVFPVSLASWNLASQPKKNVAPKKKKLAKIMETSWMAILYLLYYQNR